MGKGNKAHTAAANRIARRYGVSYNQEEGPDIQCGDFTVEVETTATLAAGVARLKGVEGRVYVAVTNKEAIDEALKLTTGTHIGVMDPQGTIVRESGDSR